MKQSYLPYWYGTCIAAAAIAFFILLSLFDLHTNPFYSAANIIFFGAGLFLLGLKCKNTANGDFKYQYGFLAMFKAGVFATLIISAVFLLYITELNTSFLAEMLTVWKEGYSITPNIVVFGLVLMGLSTSLVFSLIHMQLFKKSWNTEKGEKHTL
ncbi:MAG: DUF4199 domain-containing protein [Allomuricauda sp.]